MGIWKNAFKLPETKTVSDAEKELIVSFADKVKKRSLGDIAVIFLESTRPIHNLGAQAFVFLMPLISLVFKKEDAEKFITILENPNAVSFLIEQLEKEEEV
jgi:hypothetical protein